MLKRLIDAMAGKAPLRAKRSPQWRKVRKEAIAKHPYCAACGGVEKLEVHHIVPFHVDPTLELEPSNLIVLCESGNGGVICHLHYGHLGNYQFTNKSVVLDADTWLRKFMEDAWR